MSISISSIAICIELICIHPAASIHQLHSDHILRQMPCTTGVTINTAIIRFYSKSFSYARESQPIITLLSTLRFVELSVFDGLTASHIESLASEINQHSLMIFLSRIWERIHSWNATRLPALVQYTRLIQCSISLLISLTANLLKGRISFSTAMSKLHAFVSAIYNWHNPNKVPMWLLPHAIIHPLLPKILRQSQSNPTHHLYTWEASLHGDHLKSSYSFSTCIISSSKEQLANSSCRFKNNSV